MSASQTKAGRLSPHLAAISVSEKRLPALLAVVAGMVDLIGFLNLGNVFTAHITGNLVVLGAALVRGGPINLAPALAIPTFAVTVATIWLFAPTMAARNGGLRQRLLFAQFWLLAAVFIFSVITQPSEDPHGLAAGLGVLIAASAMACQNAMLHMTVTGAPSTAVMTGNLVSGVLGLLDAFSPDASTRGNAAGRISGFLPLLVGFFFGCVVAAAAVSLLRDWAWIFTAALAALAVVVRWIPEEG